MEWRCEWCGKPHDENDPPCDNCGHSKFEKAVVQQTDLAEGDPDSTVMWICTDCGREHPKHSPPCSRCGNTNLERREQRVDEAELSAPGYLDLVTPRYMLALGAVVLIALVFVLGLVGVIDLPGFGDGGVPEVDDVPGEATSANGTSLAAVEESHHGVVNDNRESSDRQRIERDEYLDEVATFVNQRRVKQALGDGRPVDRDKLSDLVSEECSSTAEVYPATIEQDTDDATALGQRLAAEVIGSAGWVTDAEITQTGIDVHSADDTLYLTQVVC